jgi:hypothetical protein
MAKQIEVGMDKYKDEIMSIGDMLYTNDLEGCTVVAAVWPKGSDDKTYAFFAHFAAVTIMDEGKGPTFVDEVGNELKTVISIEGGLPEKAWLIIAIDSANDEKCQAGNDLVRGMLRGADITFTEEKYRPPQYGSQIVQLFPGKDEPSKLP